jgi:hypothetical protein
MGTLIFFILTITPVQEPEVTPPTDTTWGSTEILFGNETITFEN